MIKIIFFGNTKYSTIGLQIIHEKLGISHVITIPDRLDKKRNPISSPVKLFAKQHNIAVIEADKLKPEIIDQIRNLQPDFLVVEDYGLILPQKLLDIPKYEPLNIHHSLLPKYRGPSPAPSAILAGEHETGVTIIKMIDRVDAGAIYAQERYTIKSNETTDSLLTILNTIGANLLIDVIQNIHKGKAIAKEQNEQEALYTTYMGKKDGYFDITNPPSLEQLERMIRAYYPWPGVWTRMNINGQPKIVKFLPEKKIQVEGKKPMTLKDFYNGYPELKATIEKLID